MAAPKGNQFWKARSSHGRNPIFQSPEELWKAACEYFEWVDSHPLKSHELVRHKGQAKEVTVSKMRAMTEVGLCNFLNIGQSTWYDYKQNNDFSAVTTRVSNIIYQQKFEGAAADMLNPNIIARELGLADSKNTNATEKNGTPLHPDQLKELEAMYSGPRTDYKAKLAELLNVVTEEED